MATDFGAILEAWEENHGGVAVIDKADESDSVEKIPPVSNKRLPVEDSLDLHGMTVVEAEAAVDSFLQDASKRGLRKVLFIHGKGTHSESEGVLRKEVRIYLEKHPLAGELGVPKRFEGGKGAIWAIVRQRSR